MTSAFDWSPGGCCCRTENVWFDLYHYEGSIFRRKPTMGTADADDGDSLAQIGWAVSSSSPTTGGNQGLSGAVPGQELVWNVENISGGRQIVLYDMAAQSELARVGIQDFQFAGGRGTGFGQAGGGVFQLPPTINYRQSMGVSPELFGSFFAFEPVRIQTISSAGVFTSQQETNPTPRENGTLPSIQIVAPRDWPWAAGVRNKAGSVDEREFVFGRVGIQSGTVTLLSPQVAATKPHESTVWVFFDYFLGHWAGVLQHGDGYTLLIDGTEIATYPTLKWGGVHIAFPHETLGAGYVAVATRTDEDAEFPFRTIIYKDGAEAWRTAKMRTQNALHQSNSRWLFQPVSRKFITQFESLPGAVVSEMTNGLFDTAQGAIYFMRHDGSQIIPAGRDTNTPRRMGNLIFADAGWNEFASAYTNAFTREVVRNAALIPQTSPEDLAFLAD